MPLSASFTNAFQVNVLDMLANNGIYTPPVNGLELALFTSDPGEGGSLTDEITGNGYERQSFFFDAPVTNPGGNQSSFITNSADIVFTASGGTFQDAAGQTGVGFMGIMHRKGWSRTFDYTVPYGNNLFFPVSMYPLQTTLTVYDTTVNSSTYFCNINILNYVAGTYNSTDGRGAQEYFIRVKTGPMAGQLLEIKGDGTGYIEAYLASGVPMEELDGHDIEIYKMLTVSDIFGIPSTSGTSGYMASGIYETPNSFSGSNYESINIFHAELYSGNNSMSMLYPNSTHGEWRDINSHYSGSANDAVIPPTGLTKVHDQPTSQQDSDDFVQIWASSARNANFVLTSQLSTTDVMVARAQFESGGSATTHTVTSGSTLTIAAGDLNLTLS